MATSTAQPTRTSKRKAVCARSDAARVELSAEELEYRELFLDALTAAKVLYWRQHLPELREFARQSGVAQTANEKKVLTPCYNKTF